MGWFPFFMPVMATLVSFSLSPLLPHGNFAMIYLAGVFLVAVRGGVRPALVSALISFLLYNFFYTEPHFTLFMIHREDILTVTLMVMIAVGSGHLAARLKEKAEALELSDRRNQSQIQLAQALTPCRECDQVVKTLASHLISKDHLGCQVELDLEEEAKDRESGATLQHGPDSVRVVFYARNKVAACIRLQNNGPLPAEQVQYLEALCRLAGLAWQRTLLEATLHNETLIKEREQLRSALLSSISHDLRTPLAVMIGSVSSLIDLEEAIPADQRRELLHTTLNESRRLDRYIQKLLDMTRLGHGDLPLERDWIGLDDILSALRKRLTPLLGDIQFRSVLDPHLPLLYVHPALIEQSLFNVIENAIRIVPAESEITLTAKRVNQQLVIDIADQGPGLPPSEWENIFDMFYSLSQGDSSTAGTGLGLAICSGIIGAHGGRIAVLSSSPNEGTVFRIQLPLHSPDKET